MLNTVVVGVDGSPAGQEALRWAGENVSGDLHAVHALSPARTLMEASFQIDTTTQVARIRRQLEDEWIVALPDTVRVQSTVVEDRVTDALINTAHEVSADAIVIGANGRERIGGVVGANAGRLVHKSDIPLVIVPTGAGDRESTDGAIVVAMSGDHSRDRRLVAWARWFGGADHSLTLVHSLAPAMSSQQSAPILASTATQHLQQLIDDSTTDDEIVISLDDPLTAIIENSATAPLIVMGSHHSSRLGGFLAGAIAQHLPAVSPCTVALIPLRGDD